MTCVFIALAVAATLNPVGHWEGTVETPQGTVGFQVDIAQVDGALAGAISIPQQRVKALPLTRIVVDGSSLTFGARADQLLSGDVDEQQATVAGSFRMDAYSFPFTMKRAGDPHLEPRPTSAPVASTLEGTWRATIAGPTAEAHVALTIENRSDHTAIATLVNLDEGGLQLPVVVSTSGASVTIESHVVESSFVGELTAGGELVGTFHQGAASAPVTFRR